MKRVFWFCLLIFCLILPFYGKPESFFAETNDTIIVNTSYTYLYKTEDMLEHYDFKITNQTKIPLSEEKENSYYVVYTFEEAEYPGYIKKEFASKYTPDQQKILVYNGRVNVDNTKIYDLATSEEIPGVLLKRGKEIYIYDAFDVKSDFTKIQVEYDGTIYTGEVQTKNISPNGINKTAITALIIIVTTVSIIFIFWGFRARKKKKRKLLAKTQNKNSKNEIRIVDEDSTQILKHKN